LTLSLVIANKNYSTWSLRPWLLLKHFKQPFTEIVESLNFEQHQLSSNLSKYSPSKCVPVLIDDGLHIWDSLAICEHLNDTCLQHKAWPTDQKLKSYGRSIVAEMHSAFSALRNCMPMNIRAKRKIEMPTDLITDLKRIDTIWSNAKGDWLLGSFSIADCMFAPVAFRLETYHYPLSAKAEGYRQQLLQHPAMQQWKTKALQETEIVAMDEAGDEIA